MRKALLILFIPISVFAQKDSLLSGVYSWKDPVRQKSKNLLSVVLFEGSAHNMEWLQMNNNTLLPSKTKTNVEVGRDEEQLLIMKSGKIIIHTDSTHVIGPGSVALLMPGEKYSIQNAGSDSCRYYLMKYRSTQPDLHRAAAAGGSIIKDWEKIEFKPQEKGGRRDFFERPTGMCKRFEMHVTTLKGGLKSHDPHAHLANEIIIVIDGRTEMQIAGKSYKGKAGSVYFMASNILHGIRNDGEENCSYFAFQFE